jgi:D-glycero-D-manno-heptose 1,7-bisphosphate phosphatase
MKQSALFLDRDGTLVHSSHYPSGPEQLRLYDGIGAELGLPQRMGLRLVIITNQSGIARGYFTEADLERMHEHLAGELLKQDVSLDGIYHCPHHIDGVLPELAVRCHCRKPQPGMLFQAAADLDLDLKHSWFIGDILDDVEAGNRAGCHTILVDLGTEQAPTHPLRCPTFIARNTLHALHMVRTIELLASSLDLVYRPPQWSESEWQHTSEAALRHAEISPAII